MLLVLSGLKTLVWHPCESSAGTTYRGITLRPGINVTWQGLGQEYEQVEMSPVGPVGYKLIHLHGIVEESYDNRNPPAGLRSIDSDAKPFVLFLSVHSVDFTDISMGQGRNVDKQRVE